MKSKTMNGPNTMKHNLTILILDDDQKACEKLQAAIDAVEDFSLLDITADTATALRKAKIGLPDVIILDLELHLGGGNGLFFLEDLQKLKLSIRPYLLVTTNNSSDITLEQARVFGADFIMAKSNSEYSAQYVVDFLCMMKPTIIAASHPASGNPRTESPQEHDRHIAERIQRELDLIGISPKAIGYQYLIDAILMTYHAPEPNLCRKLAEKYHKTGVSIERAIQNAINRAWRTSDPDDLLAFYTAHIRPDKGVPTLMEFVHYYARKLRQENL